MQAYHRRTSGQPQECLATREELPGAPIALCNDLLVVTHVAIICPYHVYLLNGSRSLSRHEQGQSTFVVPAVLSRRRSAAQLKDDKGKVDRAKLPALLKNKLN